MNKYILNIHTNKRTLNQDMLFKNASLSLISIATYCSEAIKKNILSFKDVNEIRLDKFIYTEFLYFYIHTMLNTADILSLTEFQKIKLRTYLENTIASFASEYFGEGETDNWKKQYAAGFINTLHVKEEEYIKYSDMKAAVLVPEFHFLTLFTKLAQNITTILDNKVEKETILLLTYELSTKAWAKMNTKELLVQLKHLC